MNFIPADISDLSEKLKGKKISSIYIHDFQDSIVIEFVGGRRLNIGLSDVQSLSFSEITDLLLNLNIEYFSKANDVLDRREIEFKWRG